MGRPVARLSLAASLLALGGSLAAQDAGAPTLVFGGDVIFDAPIEYALRRSDLDRDEPGSYAPIFEDVAPVLRAADLAFVNLETPVAVRTRSRSEGHEVPTFAAPVAFLSAVVATGVDALGVANNHAYDQGVAGLTETLSAAAAAGVVTVGAGATSRTAGAATTVRTGGHDVALLQFTEATNWRVTEDEAGSPRIAFLSEESIDRHVRAARDAGAALVVALFHWSDGRDPDHVPSSTMRGYAEAAVVAGADLVVGHGTHLPAGSDILEAGGHRAPVLWSLGNLAAVMEVEDGEIYGDEPSVRDAMLARIRTAPDGGRLRVRSIEIVPFWIDVSRADGSLPFVRPLDLTRERRIVTEEACGSVCESLAAAYERRASFLARAGISELALGSTSLPDGPPLVASLDPPPEPPPAAPTFPSAPLPAPAPLVAIVEPPPPPAVAAVEPPPPPPAVAAVEPPPPVATPEPPVPPAEPAAAPRSGRRSTFGIPPELAAGVEVRIVFPDGSATESSIDESQLGPIVDRLRADRDLYAEVVGHPSASEPDRALASRRARRLRGLIAIRGPSRSHLDSRAGSPADHAYLELRVWR